MRVPAGLDAGEIADVENESARHRIRCDRLWRPGVIADPVDDHQPCARDGSRVGSRRRRADLCLAAAAANERKRGKQDGDRDWCHTLTILILDTACNREPLSLAA